MHYSLLVIGPDVEVQMRSFEFSENNMDFLAIDVTEKVVKHFEYDFDEEGYSIQEFLEDHYAFSSKEDFDLFDHSGFYETDKDGNFLSATKVANVEPKCDWFVVGGRWSNFLICKNGKRTNQALAKNIDFSKMEIVDAILKDERWSETLWKDKDKEWNSFVRSIYKELSEEGNEEVLVTIIDCHI